MNRHGWVAYLAMGVVLTAVYPFVTPAVSKLVIWPVIGWSSVAAVAIGIRMHRPAARGAWWLLLAGLVTFIVGDDLYSIRNFVQHKAALFPSYVDAIYLAMYPLLFIGLAWLVRRRTPRGDRDGVIDAAIITTAAALLGWVLLIQPYVRATDLGLIEKLVSVAYPIGDIGLLAVALRLAIGGGRRPPAFWLLAGSIVPLIVADSLYGYLNLAGTWHEHNVIDLGWILFYVGWGAAALHPSMRGLAQPARAVARPARWRLVVVGAFALVAPLLLLTEHLRHGPVDADAIAVAAAALFGLTLLRTAGLAGAVARTEGENRFRSLVQNANDAIVVLDEQGRVLYQTPSTGRVLGHQPHEVENAPFADLLHPSDRPRLSLLLADPASTPVADWRIRRADGAWRNIDVATADLRGDASVRGVVLTIRDSTERKELDAGLRQLAFHDSLTGLANRALFVDRVIHALNRSERASDGVAVVFLDLDDFKMVNDGLGHSAGDTLLQAVARRLVTAVRPSDTVARFGGDEFAILLEVGSMPAAAEVVAERVTRALARAFPVAGDEVTVTASIGIAYRLGASADDADPEELLRDADLAMYMAKRNGKGRHVEFQPQMHEDARRRLEMAADLRRAIDHGELTLLYQPIVDLASRRLVGAEALVRWTHPRAGVLSPAEFIPIAESTGLIVPLGRWVLNEACRQVGEWKDARRVGADFHMSVNLAARQLMDAGLLDDVARSLADHGLDPGCLQLEVTESTLMDDLDVATSRLGALKAMGVNVAVDDFGTGYSSLSYLRAFPVDVIKIDKSFVDRVATTDDGIAMVRAVIDLTRALGLTAVAEGIEDEAQLTALVELGCQRGQGYLFARPIPAVELSALPSRLEPAAVG